MCRPGLFTVSPSEEEIEGGHDTTEEFPSVEVGVRGAGQACTTSPE
jgi:hypothetical protein